MKFLDNLTGDRPSRLMGIIALIYGVYSCIWDYGSLTGIHDILWYSTYVVILLFGVILTFKPAKSTKLTVVSAGILLGIVLIVRFVDGLIAEDTFTFFTSAALFTMGVLLIWYSVMFYCGYTRYSLRMRYVVIFILISILWAYIYDIHMLLPIHQLLDENQGSILTVALLLVFLYMLSIKGVGHESSKTRLSNDISVLESKYYVGGILNMSREDIDVLINLNNPAWEDSEHKHYTKIAVIKLENFAGRPYMVLKKWKIDGNVMLQFFFNKRKTIVGGMEVCVAYVTPNKGTFQDCDAIRIYDGNGGFIILSVVDGPIVYPPTLMERLKKIKEKRRSKRVNNP